MEIFCLPSSLCFSNDALPQEQNLLSVINISICVGFLCLDTLASFHITKACTWGMFQLKNKKTNVTCISVCCCGKTGNLSRM